MLGHSDVSHKAATLPTHITRNDKKPHWYQHNDNVIVCVSGGHGATYVCRWTWRNACVSGGHGATYVCPVDMAQRICVRWTWRNVCVSGGHGATYVCPVDMAQRMYVGGHGATYVCRWTWRNVCVSGGHGATYVCPVDMAQRMCVRWTWRNDLVFTLQRKYRTSRKTLSTTVRIVRTLLWPL